MRNRNKLIQSQQKNQLKVVQLLINLPPKKTSNLFKKFNSRWKNSKLMRSKAIRKNKSRSDSKFVYTLSQSDFQ